jgi:nicotinamidase-related amidase
LPRDSEHVIEKNVADAFKNSGLEHWPPARGIKDLLIVGVSTNMSVEATARSAGSLGFRTIVVSDATFTFDRADISGAMRTAEETSFDVADEFEWRECGDRGDGSASVKR